MISSGLSRLGKAAFFASALCLPNAATAAEARKPYLLQPEKEDICKSRDRSFSSSSFPGRVYAVGLGTAAAAGGELGGTVAVVSPALSRRSHPQTKVRRREVRGLLRPLPRPLPPPLPFTAKWKAASGYPASNHSVCPENDLAQNLAFITVPVGIITATVGKFPDGRKVFWLFWFDSRACVP